MAYDEKVAERIRSALENRNDVREVKMMGGLIFMVKGHMCCGATGADLMLRVGPDAYKKALSSRHVRPLDIGGGRTPRAFVCVEAAGIKTTKALSNWIQQGVDFVETLPKKAVRN